MEPQGPVLARGRDGVVYEHGSDKALRVVPDGRSLVREAEVMHHAASHGFPVPRVYGAGDGWLLMERVHGPVMLDAATRPPFRVRHYARMLADLHRRLHEIRAPDWLPQAPVPGDRLVHRDLHPLNVQLSTRGLVVIDWTNASAGAPAFDVADAWVLLKTATIPESSLRLRAAELGRDLFLGWFLSAADRDAARQAIPAAVAHRLTDRNHTPEERARMQTLADWARS
jgi:aminoglycoside phosphotransferase (APT) family kinase protein